MFKIESLRALEILDSRGFPTVEAHLTLQGGYVGKACVPSGASTGVHEALEKRDGDARRFFGKGVLGAVKAVEKDIALSVVGETFSHQKQLDEHLIQLDGTHAKSNLGANAILAVSMAFLHAVAQAQNCSVYQCLPSQERVLPTPMMNIINGGSHANNGLSFQEFMIVPSGASSFSEALRMGSEIFHRLKIILNDEGFSTAVGDEGGFSPDFKNNQQALDYIMRAIETAGYQAGKDIYLALDVASSEFYQLDGLYHLEKENRKLDATGLIDYLFKWSSRYPIISIEDGLDQNDFEGWRQLTSRLGKHLQIVGDDLFVTNSKLLQKGIDENCANAILIKPNQIGTLTETMEAIKLAQNNEYGTVMSHRSGETEDTTIADLAVGCNTQQIKTGSMSRTDRIAKYNRLLRIGHELGDKCQYAGFDPFLRFSKL